MAERSDKRSDDIDEEVSLRHVGPELPMPVVRRIAVKDLFGRYSYNLEAPPADDGVSRLMILHGDNGTGKTTLLKLVWNLLSTAEMKGHRSRIAKTPFSEFLVEFTDGRRVAARKAGSLVGAFDMVVSGPPLREKEVTGTFIVDEKLDVSPTPDYGLSRGSLEWKLLTDGTFRQLSRLAGESEESIDVNDHSASGIRRVMAFLRELKVEPVLLADDRQLHSDKVDTARESDRGDSTPSERVAEELRETFAKVNRYLRSKTISAQRLGSSEEAQIYLNVLTRIRNYGSHSEPGKALERVESNIDELARLVPDFAEFELITDFDPEDIRRAVRSVGTDNRAVANAIILPYLESMRARFVALTDAQRIIRLLTTHANRYLRDKRLVYSPQPGLRVVTDESKPRALRPTNLSSGERQMLLLLCNAVLAAVDRTLFLIDEPELSLGVPWQRQILSSLLDLTSDTDVQFIVATHSIEMISANRASLVKLVNEVG